ncbi:MAG: hypothetical protein VR67_14025 [Peptococcaceae bacterium BRH_c8a]|nr:MAG: hypothetical protein VR67_14025 [Peptococcaceae bacterium BRH_c8a]
MTLAVKRSSSISKIINDKGIITHFQPIVSVKKKSVIGLEALSRGICPDSGGILPPNTLFSLAEENNLTLDLDRLCRQKAMENFNSLDLKNRDIILFMNFDTSIIDLGIVGSGHLLNQVRQLNLNPNNVVIEIIESRVNDTRALNEFINRHREYGFLFALDDIGSGYSNLDRITITKPDLLKIDRSLISGIDINYHKQEVLKSLVNLAKRIGTLVVAEGVEREDEAITSLELGVDMLQGFYFSRPMAMLGNDLQVFKERINLISDKFKNYMVNKINDAKYRHMRYQTIANHIIHNLSAVNSGAYNALLKDLISQHPNLECIYLLDEQGIQISDTFCNYRNILSHRGSIFRPAPKGADHSLKDYYYLLTNTGMQRFTTAPYISLASGNLCITISTLFKVPENDRRYILCIDLNQNL